jgi:hypothetical protein
MKNVSTNHQPSLSAENSASHNNENVYSTNHALNVSVVSGGSGGTQYAEGATTSPATGTVALGRYLASAPGTLADGAFSAPLLDNFGQLKVVPVGTSSVNIAQVGGASLALGQTTMSASLPITIASNQSSFPVTLTSTSITSLIPGTGSTNLGAAVDAARGITKTGVVALAIREDTPANQVSAVGDYAELQIDGTGRLWTNSIVAGDIAAAATDSGNPVKIGGKYNTTKPTYTDGQRGDIQIGTRGSVAVSLFAADSTTGASFMVDNADAVAASGTANKLAVLNRNTVFNGSTWDRMYGDATSGQYVNIRNGLMPAGTALNTYSVRITTNTTNTPTSSTAYISSISISSEVTGTTSTVTIQDKQGTPLKLVNGFSTTALTTTPTVVNFQTPVKMTSGIDVITAGAVAATVDVWINYYQ